MRLAQLSDRLGRSVSARTAIALTASVAAVYTFIEVAENVLQKESDAFDRAASVWMHHFDSPATDMVMRVFTFLGSAPPIIIIVAIVAAWAIRRRKHALAGVLVAVASVAEGLNLFLKGLFQRPRPDLFSEILAPKSYSFPSGHSMAAAAVYGMSAFVIARLRPERRTLIYVLAPILVGLIGASRVFLGVHWPTDVLAGFAAGGLIHLAGVLALGRVDRPPTSSAAHG